MKKSRVNHLLFECVVVKSAWELVKEATRSNVGVDYELVAKAMNVQQETWYY
jgi:hypothetical protein